MCARLIGGPQGKDVRAWLHSRGFDDITISANLIGVDPSRLRLRRPKGLPTGVGVAATFPAFDPSGNLTYVQARYLQPDVTGRKYDNPSAALAPHPRLAFPIAPRLRDASTVLVCEGLPDALTAAQEGFSAIGLLGAHTPDEAVAARIASYAANRDLGVTLVCDPDDAGRRVADVLAPLLARAGVEPDVVTPPDGLDLNAWALSDSSWAEQLGPSPPLRMITTSLNNGREL
ncbi:MAG: toprim domain-containing protein [Ilumatobacteraceae bacterium]